MKLILIIFLTVILQPFSGYSASLSFFSDSNVLATGIWRAEILRGDGHAIPFIFEIKDTAGKKIMYVINGADRMLVDNIAQQQDSLFIDMPFFDSHFALKIESAQKLTGIWIKNFGTRQALIPFQAVFNNDKRFPVTRSPAFDISGRWAVHFQGAKHITEAIGEFKQYGSRVTGTFLTTTGDYRYLDGIIDGDTLKLSTFDGGHAYLFVSNITGSNSMIQGFFYDGATSTETWSAEKKDSAKLPDEFGLTHLKDSANASLHFRFPDLTGNMVSINDAYFKNKVVIVQIMGSWCPNCMDETRFLSPWYIQNKNRGIAVVGLAYERTSSLADAERLLQPFISRFHVTYPILATGVTVSDSLRTEKTLPEILQIMGFPTTIFIDKKGIIRKIHTGFNGPGTGDHYEIFQKEFNELVDSLLKE